MRVYGGIVSLIVCAVVFSPVRQNWSDPPVDDFPLSWFPMFSAPRPALEAPEYVIGVDAAGKRYKVGQTWWTSGGFNQGSSQLRAIRKRGSKALGPFCERVAKKIAERKSSLDPVVEVQVMHGRYSRERWFRDGDPTPESERMVWRCPVTREQK